MPDIQRLLRNVRAAANGQAPMPVYPDTLSLADAARATGRQPATIRHWIDLGLLTAEEAEKERTPGQSESWRINFQALRRVHWEQGGRQWNPEAIRARVMDTEAEERIITAQERIAQLERENAALRAQLEGAKAREARRETEPPPMDEMAEKPRSEPITRPLVPRPPMPHRRRPRLAEVLEPLPDGWMSVNAWCQHHGLDKRTVDRAIDEGDFPRPEQRIEGYGWVKGPNQILTAYTPEQHAEACVRARARWPHTYKSPCGPTCPDPGLRLL